MKSKKLLISVGLAVVLVVAFALPACGEPVVTAHRMTVGTLTDVPNLNMDEEELEHSNMGCIYKRMVYETLTSYPKVGEVGAEDTNAFLPKLATSVDVTYEERFHPVSEVMQDAQVWTVHLREGVKWHDFATSGEYLDAEDVKFTCENALSEWDPAKPICWEEYWYGEGEIYWWLNVTGDYTIEFICEHNITEAHNPSVWAWDCIIPEHVFGPEGEGVYDDWNVDPKEWDGEHIGTGAFKWAEYKPGQYHKWVRNDDWWGSTDPRYGPIEIEELYIQIFPSMESLTAAFEAGEIDTYMSTFSYTSIPSFEAEEDITWEVMPGIAIYYLGFNFWAENEEYDYSYYNMTSYELGGLNYTENPLHDVALRQAIAYAIDAQQMIDVIYGGSTYAELIAGWVYPEMTGFNPDLEMYAQNVTEAAQLLTDEGYTKPGLWWVSPYTDEELSFKLRTSTDIFEVDTGQAIHDDLEAFGIHIDFQTIDATTFMEALYQPWSNGWDLMVGEEEPSADPIADWIWMLITDPWYWGWDWAPTYWYNEEFNAEYEGIYVTEDPDVPRRECQRIANEELPMYMLYRQHVVSAYWTDRWTGWYNELGGPVYWFNPWSIYEAHWVGGD